MVHSFVKREYGDKAKITEFPKKMSPIKELLASMSMSGAALLAAQAWKPRFSAEEVALVMDKYATEGCMFELK